MAEEPPLVDAAMPGVFDLLHVGHVRALRFAADRCERLFVLIQSDAACEAQKRKPVMCEDSRQEMVASLKGVVRTAGYDDLRTALEALPESVKTVFHGPDLCVESRKAFDDVVSARGWNRIVVPRTEQTSTTSLISRIRLPVDDTRVPVVAIDFHDTFTAHPDFFRTMLVRWPPRKVFFITGSPPHERAAVLDRLREYGVDTDMFNDVIFGPEYSRADMTKPGHFERVAVTKVAALEAHGVQVFFDDNPFYVNAARNRGVFALQPALSDAYMVSHSLGDPYFSCNLQRGMFEPAKQKLVVAWAPGRSKPMPVHREITWVTLPATGNGFGSGIDLVISPVGGTPTTELRSHLKLPVLCLADDFAGSESALAAALQLALDKKDLAAAFPSTSDVCDFWSSTADAGLGSHLIPTQEPTALEPALVAGMMPCVERAIALLPRDIQTKKPVVLDLGCGPGAWVSTLSPHASSLILVDAVSSWVDVAAKRAADSGMTDLTTIKTDVCDGLPAGVSADIVFCCGVTPYAITKTRLAGLFRTIKMSLRPMGLCVLKGSFSVGHCALYLHKKPIAGFPKPYTASYFTREQVIAAAAKEDLKLIEVRHIQQRFPETDQLAMIFCHVSMEVEVKP